MPKFFTTDISGGLAKITGDDARHIARSLRMREGDALTVGGLDGFDYDCALRAISDELAVAEVLKKRPCTAEPRARISLYQALPKSDKLDFVVQKAVELGAHDITPVLTSRCVARWEQKDVEKKTQRLQKIAAEAAKQSGRGIIPRVLPLLLFGEALSRMNEAALRILFYENAATPLRSVLVEIPNTVAVMVGSEGGFSPEEAQIAENSGVCLASLGPRILRCETAPVAALAALGFALGDL